jgi:pimeloyl-ACP methyl ester carboxylesterase
VIPGIGGSVLARGGHPVWSPRPGAALRAVFSLGKSISSLTLAGDDHTLDDLGDDITAPALLPDLHIVPGLDWKIDGYSRLRQRLFERFDLADGGNYLEFPYDWRRDTRVAARRLATVARAQLARWRQSSGNADAKLVLVGHSMGGIVARLFLELHDGWTITRRLVTFGTPYAGSVNALEFLVNGFRVGWGPFTADLSAMLRSFTSVYHLLPSYRCVRVGAEWKLLDEIGPLPNVDAARLADALALHRALRAAVDAQGAPLLRYDIRPLVGDSQRTRWGASLTNDRVAVRFDRGPGEDGGDGTVPRVSAMPHELLNGWRNAAFFSEKHASLQNDDAVFDHVAGVLRAQPIDLLDIFPAGDIPVALETEDTTTDQPLVVRARPRDPVSDLTATITSIRDGSAQQVSLAQRADGWYEREVPGLPAHDFRVRVSGPGVRTVTDVASVVDVQELMQLAGV